MDHRAALILAASLLCGSVHAGYAQLAPPEGWSGGGGGAATYRFPSAANAASYTGGNVLTNASLNVGGRAVTVPASMRMASNAGRIAAAAIYLHPALRTAAVVASWVGAAGFAYDVSKGWLGRDDEAIASDGYVYRWDGDSRSFPAIASAGAFAVSTLNSRAPEQQPWLYESLGPFGEMSGNRLYSIANVTCRHVSCGFAVGYKVTLQVNFSRSNGCPVGWYSTSAGCVQTPPMKTVTKEEFEQLVPDARPMPPELPGVVWPASWPVEVPQVQPTFVPTGAPVKNPSYDPSKPTSPDNQPWVQPGVKVTPAPAANAPWQVNLQPVNRPVEGPTASPDPVVDPVPNPGTDPGADSTDKPREPEKDERDFCDKHPDVIACQKLDEPEDPGELKTKAVDLDFQVQSGYAGSAVCPAPMTYEAFGHVLSLSWQPFCDSLAMVKNLLLAFAWISAAFILLGAKKE